uniref:Uncharacterized protein n=1 Tax=Arundo donax TaxID=35708 RepID=A0A0A9F0U7_ARUDO
MLYAMASLPVCTSGQRSLIAMPRPDALTMLPVCLLGYLRGM